MKAWSHVTKVVLVFAVVGVLAQVPCARAQHAVDPDAQKALAAMSNYLGGLKSFSVEYSAVDEVVKPDGQKVQFLHSGEIMVQRPNKLYGVRKGAAGVAQMFLDGKRLTLYGKNVNAYLQLDAPSIDAAVDAVHNFGYDAPGADFLISKPLDSSTTDMTSGDYIGTTFIDGVGVVQLAFRGANVDWQLWVTAGDKPLPLRYVVTTKWFTGSPQYTLQLKNWNTAPQIDAKRFIFAPPPGAKKLDPAMVTVNAVGDLTVKGK